MDFLIEFVLEIFVEGYLEIMVALIPKDSLNPKVYKFLKVLCAVISAVCVIALMVGFMAMISNDTQEKIGGRYVFFIALSFTLIQITIGAISKIKPKK